MIEYEDANQILAELSLAVDIAMEGKDIADLAKAALRVSIQENVYGQYSPFMYKRRGDEGGLADYDNIQATYHPADKELEIEAIATGNPNYTPTDGRLDDLIESGTYNYRPADGSLGPRPFYEKAEAMLEAQMPIIEDAVAETINSILDGSL